MPTRDSASGEAAGSLPRTLRRGLQVLGALRDAGPDGLHVVEVAQATGLQRPTVYRYLDVLVEEGYAQRNPRTKRFGIAMDWAPQPDAHGHAVRRLQPVLRHISDITGDSTFLICRAGSDSLCLHREVGNYALQVLSVTIGHRQPLGVGAAGLALLAALPANEASELIAQNDKALRAYGGMTAAQMHRLVDNTRDRGWSVVGNSAVPGALGVGVPVLDERGYPVLAISTCTMIDRIPASRQRQIAEQMRAAVARVGG